VKIDRDGSPFIALASVPAALALALGRRRTALGLVAAPLGVAAFFRDPERSPDHGAPVDEDTVLSPADGKVMYVGPADPAATPDGEWQQIVIFLSVTDVHINRSPYAGTVTDVTYRPGRFLAAFTPESGSENERSEITLVRDLADGTQRTVVFRQIVGMLARRVVTRVRPGDEVATGARIGLMKFGSRMDVFLPHEVEILVGVGDRVVAGETVLARWPSPVAAASTGSTSA
jgi:phosphatidylserine decarboxylase